MTIRLLPIFLLMLTLTGCGVGNFVARVDDTFDRVCLKNDFPASVVEFVYSEWKIPSRPQIVNIGCNLVFELAPGGLGWATTGETILGVYEPGGIFRGAPTVNVAPLYKLPTGKGVYSKEVASHEFGHAMFDNISFFVYNGDSHNKSPNSRMHYLYLPGQVVTQQDKYYMNAARLRHPAPRVISVKVLPNSK